MAEQTTAAEEPTVLVVMGVSGTGKSTVAGLLADRLGWELAEGDDLHPDALPRQLRVQGLRERRLVGLRRIMAEQHHLLGAPPGLP